MNSSVIVNEGGQLRSASGTDAIEAYRLRCLMVALRFQVKTGMRVSRNVNALKLAKLETGLRTNDAEKLLQRLQIKLDAQLAKCVVINDGE